MKKSLYRWEIALIIGFMAALLCAAAVPSERLSDKLVRLHVIAASDSDADQALKLRVKDEVIRHMEQPLAGITDPDTAKAVIEAHIPALQAALEAFLLAEGSDQTVSVALRAHTGFPTKEYGGFALPAGQYTALQVVLGEGKGQNWWCVVFPPLCAAAAMDSLEDTSRQAGLTEDEIGLITRDGTEYILRFKILEWFGRFRQK